MTRDEKHRKWLRILRERGWTVKEATQKLRIHIQTGYSYNSGQCPIPDEQLDKLEALK
jgi:hypothetical protein